MRRAKSGGVMPVRARYSCNSRRTSVDSGKLASSSCRRTAQERAMLFPFRQFPNDVVDEVGTGDGLQILWPYQGWRRLLLPGHFGSILEVRDLATVPGPSAYGRQASNVIGDRLTSRTPDPHRGSNIFLANRP